MKTIVLLLLTVPGFSQVLHHQMLSVQGTSKQFPSGMAVSQSIGQQSAIGNFNNSNTIVGQGFQQNNVMKPAQSKIISITTVTYPNPFIDEVHFKFSSPVLGPIKISLYDILGRLMYSKEKISSNNSITIDNLSLSQGEYFVKLTAKNYVYTTNLLKSK